MTDTAKPKNNAWGDESESDVEDGDEIFGLEQADKNA